MGQDSELTHTDHLATHFPISVKGIVFVGSRVLLLRNERNQWELPGGKLEPRETPEDCCAREILEETALEVSVQALIDAWVYELPNDLRVLILSYGCALQKPDIDIKVSSEHEEARLFARDDIPLDATPSGYVRSIDRWTSLRQTQLSQLA